MSSRGFLGSLDTKKPTFLEWAFSLLVEQDCYVKES